MQFYIIPTMMINIISSLLVWILNLDIETKEMSF